MLKFSGWPRRPSGQQRCGCCAAALGAARSRPPRAPARRRCSGVSGRLARAGVAPLSRAALPAGPGRPRGARAARVPPSTLTPACSRPKPRAPCAFEDSMVHVGLQFTTHIAFRGVLHRPGSRGIHRRKLWHFRMSVSLRTLLRVFGSAGGAGAAGAPARGDGNGVQATQ